VTGTDVCMVTWYNQPYLKEQLKSGLEYSFYGKISKKGGQIEMNSPVFDKKGEKKNTRKDNTYLSTYIWSISKSNKKNY